MRLREELERMARDVDTGPDPARVWRAARRRRTARLAVAPALAAVLALAVVLVPALLSDHRSAPSGAAPTPEASLPALREIRPPANAIELPADRPVGVAAFIYGDDTEAYLVTTGGEQYALPGGVSADLVSLSPDGRWLLRGTQLRDLTGTGVRQIEPGSVRAWSPDGRLLLLNSWLPPAHGSKKEQQRIIEVATGQVRPVHTNGRAVLDDGSVLAADDEEVSGGNPKDAVLRVLDPVTGAQLRQITVDASPVLPGEAAIEVSVNNLGGRPGELSINRAVAGPGDRILLEVVGMGPAPLAVVASLHDGQVLGVVDAPAVPSGNNWYALGFVGDHILLKGAGVAPSGLAGGPIELVATKPGGGSAHPLYRLPPNVLVLAPGSVYPV